MRTRTRTTIGAAAAVAALLTAPQVATATDRDDDRRNDLRAIGLVNDKKLVSFEVERPEKARTIGRVTGLTGDVRLVGIDFRVQDGLLYGLGDAGGIYTIDTGTAAATRVSQLTIALEGGPFDIDFNPAADALRIVSSTGVNLRHPFAGPTAGTTARDGDLTYPATPTTPATLATGVSAAAYTNNDLDANSGTTLYDIDTTLDQVVIQSPANAGAVVATGKLGVDAGADAGFDIHSRVQQGKAGDLHAYATLEVGGRYQVYEVRLSNGEVTHRGGFRPTKQAHDIAMPLDQR